MAAKKKLRMRGVKHTPKRLEDELLEKSRILAENPEILRPKCNGKCMFCPFKKTFAAINRLGSTKDDADALTKLASKGGDDIFKAYCATISLNAAGNIPYLASAKLGGEVLSYAQRGSVGNDKLIGCQYYDDPKHRLFLYGGLAKKKKIHVYSYGSEIFCSKAPGMPEDYLYDTFWDSPYEFPDDEIQCGHESVGVLVIRCKSANKEIRICKDCAKDVSALQYIISRIACRDPLDDFEVYVEHKYHSAGGNGKRTIDGEMLAKYSKGGITDVGIINSVLKDEMGSLKNAENATYIIGSKNYGSDLDAFLTDLNGSDVEKMALKSYLSKNKVSVVTRTDRASDALNSIWSDARNVILSFTNEETADSVEDYSKLNPASTVKIMHQKFVSQDIVAKLPVFKRPGPVTKYADAYAKAVKVGGADMLTEVFNNFAPKAGKNRALAKAFCDIAECGDAIKCTDDEVEFSQFLLPFAKQLIESEGEDYREKMNTLLTAMGCGETV